MGSSWDDEVASVTEPASAVAANALLVELMLR